MQRACAANHFQKVNVSTVSQKQHPRTARNEMETNIDPGLLQIGLNKSLHDLQENDSSRFFWLLQLLRKAARRAERKMSIHICASITWVKIVMGGRAAPCRGASEVLSRNVQTECTASPCKMQF